MILRPEPRRVHRTCDGPPPPLSQRLKPEYNHLQDLLVSDYMQRYGVYRQYATDPSLLEHVGARSALFGFNSSRQDTSFCSPGGVHKPRIIVPRPSSPAGCAQASDNDPMSLLPRRFHTSVDFPVRCALPSDDEDGTW